MIIDAKEKDNILETKLKNIAFPVNTNGIIDNNITDKLSAYWPELLETNTHKLGSSFSKTIKGKTYHAIVCYSYDGEIWSNQTETIKSCFDSIATDEPIASFAIGTDQISILSGANFQQIVYGMDLSCKKIVLYGKNKHVVDFLIKEEKFRSGFDEQIK